MVPGNLINLRFTNFIEFRLMGNTGSVPDTPIKQVKSFNTARVVKQMSILMLKYAIYAFSVEKQLKSVLNI